MGTTTHEERLAEMGRQIDELDAKARASAGEQFEARFHVEQSGGDRRLVGADHGAAGA